MGLEMKFLRIFINRTFYNVCRGGPDREVRRLRGIATR